MLKLIELYEEYDYLFALALSVLMWICGYFTTRFAKHIKKQKLNQILDFKKEDVEVLLPVRHGRLELTNPYGATELVDNFVTYDEMRSLLKLEEMIDEIGLNICFSSDSSLDKSNNVFCIGGPLSNINTANYFRDTKIFAPITFGVACDSQYLSDKNRAKLSDLVHEDVGSVGTIRVNGKQIFDFKREHEGYVFLAKLSGKSDFADREHGTVHICFGNNSKTTYAAITSYMKHRTELNIKLKNRSNYCLLIKCDINGNINLNHCKDITDSVLIQNIENHIPSQKEAAIVK